MSSSDEKETRPHSYMSFHAIYLVLLLWAALLIFFELYSYVNTEVLSNKEEFGVLGGGIALCLIFYFLFAFVHLFSVYNSLYEIEDEAERWKTKTSGFVGKKRDKLLRLSVFVFMLLAFAKASVLFDTLKIFTDCSTQHANSFTCYLSSYGEDENKMQVFLFCMGVSSAFLTTWDLILWASLPKESNPISLSKHEALWWLATDFLATVIWFSFVSILIFSASGVLFIFIIIATAFYGTIVVIRFWQTSFDAASSIVNRLQKSAKKY